MISIKNWRKPNQSGTSKNRNNRFTDFGLPISSLLTSNFQHLLLMHLWNHYPRTSFLKREIPMCVSVLCSNIKSSFFDICTYYFFNANFFLILDENCIYIFRSEFTVGQKIKKIQGKKKLVKSNKSISRTFFLPNSIFEHWKKV